MAPTPEDQNDDGFNERPSVKWWLWCTDIATEFCNGVIAGCGAGAVVGGANAASSDTTDSQALSISAAIGFIIAALANGLKHAIIFQHNNPMPNPFRRVQTAVPPSPVGPPPSTVS